MAKITVLLARKLPGVDLRNVTEQVRGKVPIRIRPDGAKQEGDASQFKLPLLKGHLGNLTDVPLHQDRLIGATLAFLNLTKKFCMIDLQQLGEIRDHPRMLNIPGRHPYVEARSVPCQDLSVSIQNEPPASFLHTKAKMIAFGEVLIPIAFQNLQLPESEQQKEEYP